MPNPNPADLRGFYNVEYFSGAQALIYIGDILVDEITSINFRIQQDRSPIYGYASTFFDDVSEGTKLVIGSFSINFKEAGYLWLILNRYQHMTQGKKNKLNPFHENAGSEAAHRRTIEMIVNGEMGAFEKNKTFQQLTAHASLTGFASRSRALASNPKETGKGVGKGFLTELAGRSAESVFESFENFVWGGPRGTITTFNQEQFNVNSNRQADDPDLNPFDIYVTFGDYVADDSMNHTVQRLDQVYILGNSKQIVIDGQPIQEVYNFIARDLV
jgi:hypothetical protein